MGSVPSKAARKLSREKPSWSGSRVQSPAATAEQARVRPERPLAFESRNEGEQDAVYYSSGVEYAFEQQSRGMPRTRSLWKS